MTTHHVRWLRLMLRSTLFTFGIISTSPIYCMNLGDAYHIATQHNTQYQQAMKEFKTIESLIPPKFASLLNEVAFAPSPYSQNTSVNPNRLLLSDNKAKYLLLDIPSPLLWNKINHSKELSTLIKKNIHTLELAKTELFLQISVAYFNVLEAIDDLNFTITEKNDIVKLLQHLTNKSNADHLAVADIGNTKAKLEMKEAYEQVARNNLANRYEELAKIIGQKITNINHLNFDYNPLTPNSHDITKWLNIALEQNHYLKNLELSSEDTIKNKTTKIKDNNSLEISSLDKLNIDQVQTEISNQVRETYRAALSSIYQMKALSSKKSPTLNQKMNVDILDNISDSFDERRRLARSRYEYITNVVALKVLTSTLSNKDLLIIDSLLPTSTSPTLKESHTISNSGKNKIPADDSTKKNSKNVMLDQPSTQSVPNDVINELEQTLRKLEQSESPTREITPSKRQPTGKTDSNNTVKPGGDIDDVDIKSITAPLDGIELNKKHHTKKDTKNFSSGIFTEELDSYEPAENNQQIKSNSALVEKNNSPHSDKKSNNNSLKDLEDELQKIIKQKN